MINEHFFDIVSLLAVTKFRYYQSSKVVLYFADGKVTFQRWEGDGTRMQMSISTCSNEFSCCIGDFFSVAYREETLYLNGTDINGAEFKYSVYVGSRLLQNDVSMDELLEDN